MPIYNYHSFKKDGTITDDPTLLRLAGPFKFPGTSIDLDFGEVIGADLQGQVFNGQPIIALIGRDILSDCVFIFNGKSGMYTLAH